MTTGIPDATFSLTTHTTLSGGLIVMRLNITQAGPDDWPFIRSMIAAFLRHQDPQS